MNCLSCVYSHPNELDDGQWALQCRRYPPQIVALDDMVVQAWPQVDESDTCGEGREP